MSQRSAPPPPTRRARAAAAQVLALGFALALALGLGALPAGADVIDLGAQVPQRVHFLGDALTYVEIPPGAFGSYQAGTLAQLTLDSPSCNGPYCVGGQALLVTFDGRFPGDLLLPVTFSMRYDEDAVRAFGVPESDILFCRYDVGTRAWLPMPGQTIDSQSNRIAALESQNIRQSVAVFAQNPAPVGARTWGAIKARFQGD